MRYYYLALTLLCSVALAQSPEASDSVQEALDTCKSDGQTVSYETIFVPGKPATEPATPEEEERVKQVLAEAGAPYDRANHRATYDATLAMLRATRHLQVKIAPATASPAFDAARQCIQDLMQRSGVSGEVIAERSSVASGSVSSCEANGAFGIEFGAPPKKLGTKIRESAATIAYEIVPPRPDERFDKFVVVVDKQSKNALVIEALKRTVSWPPANRAATRDEIAVGERNADAFARAYFESLPSQIQAALGARRDTGSWKGDITEKVSMSILASSPWEVSVLCQDNEGTNAAVRRVW